MVFSLLGHNQITVVILWRSPRDDNGVEKWVSLLENPKPYRSQLFYSTDTFMIFSVRYSLLFRKRGDLGRAEVRARQGQVESSVYRLIEECE